ncbi:MAG: hypothetical protein AAF689_16930 [Pseudomonadota bacterium]
MSIARFATLLAAGALSLTATGAAQAEDATGTGVIFDNAIDPAAADEIIDAAHSLSASETLFLGWQMSYQMYQDAAAIGAASGELTALEAASTAAGAAYEAALIAQNTVQLAAAGPEPMSDEMLAELFAPIEN